MAPDFSATAVVDQEFKEISLSQYRGKYVVLFFYPLDFTFVCPTEITAFSDRYADFSSKNTEVLAVSVDSKYSHLAWIQTPRNQGGIGDIAYPLVADLKKEICAAYNVLNEDGEADRGLFIINPQGMVMHMTVNKALLPCRDPPRAAGLPICGSQSAGLSCQLDSWRQDDEGSRRKQGISPLSVDLLEEHRQFRSADTCVSGAFG